MMRIRIKKLYILVSIISAMILIYVVTFIYISSGTDSKEYMGDFAKPGSSTDIMAITKCYSKSDPIENDKLELQVGTIFKNINNDQSPRANRVIGKIEEKNITAKELELRALKFQASGYQKPYYDAWNALKLNIEEERLAEKYGININDAAQKDTENLKDSLMNDSKAKAILEKQIHAYGMTENEYWDLSYNSTRRLILHNYITEYLKKNELKPINTADIKNQIIDKEYLNKIQKSQ